MKLLRGAAAILLAAWMLGTVAFADVSDSTAPFPDVMPDAEYAQAVAELANLGVITGDDKGNFNPDSTITRAETAAIICRLLGVETLAGEPADSPFSDVPASHWAAGYVSAASDMNIINGYGNGKFGPSDPVTYEQMAKMLVCAWGNGDMAEERGGYPDGYLEVAEEMGLLDGLSADAASPAPRWAVAMMAMTASMQPTNYEGGDVE